jgi:CsoR family transcriptional regulator, copper-sensing transcriptional repressor
MTPVPYGKEDIINRLARLEGQIRGVRKMIDEDKACEEIVTQLSAVHSALENVSKIAITAFFDKCLLECESRGEDRRQAMERLAGLLLKSRL